MATTGPLHHLSTAQRRAAAPFARGRQNEGGDHKRSFRFLVTLFFPKTTLLEPGAFLEHQAIFFDKVHESQYTVYDGRIIDVSRTFPGPI